MGWILAPVAASGTFYSSTGKVGGETHSTFSLCNAMLEKHCVCEASRITMRMQDIVSEQVRYFNTL